MRDELLLYYERELNYLRQMGVQFAERYPKVASRLLLEPDKCEDPHVERLLEAFAFLAARVHLKIDDEFPEITEALLSIVYPHYIQPVPSMSIAEFQIDPEQKLTAGYRIERHSTLYSRPVGGIPCKFRTCFDTTLWPVSVTAAEWKSPDRLQPAIRAADAVGAIRLELRASPEAPFASLGMDDLRFYLSGESHLVFKLCELLGSRLTRIVVRDPSRGAKGPQVTLPVSALEPGGFAEDEGLFPYTRRSFLGYRLLVEYFTFPEKFLFFSLKGLAAVWEADFKDQAEIVFLISRFEGEDRPDMLERGVTAGTFRLGCTPIVNLFSQTAEPLLLDQKKYEYPIIPDVRRPNATEVFSIDEVSAINVDTQEVIHFRPFYSFQHGLQDAKQKAFWISHRHASERPNDEGTDMTISLVDLSLRPVHPASDTLTIRTMCTNRNLPAKLPFGSETGDFELENSGPVGRITALTRPTPPRRPPIGRAAQWRLISHLSLNYLSLVTEGREALQQILTLYDFADSPSSKKMIEGIIRLESSPHFAGLFSEHGVTFTRGTRVEIEFDESQFVGGGVYLLATVLEHFLGQYVTLNSFSQLVATSKQRKEVLREWPPRAGRRILM